VTPVNSHCRWTYGPLGLVPAETKAPRWIRRPRAEAAAIFFALLISALHTPHANAQQRAEALAGRDTSAVQRGSRFSFDHTPLQQAAALFSRANDKPIVFLDSGADDVPITGDICSSDFDSFVRILAVFYQLVDTPAGVRVGGRINPRARASPD